MNYTRSLFLLFICLSLFASCADEDPSNLRETWEATEAIRVETNETFRAWGVLRFYDDVEKTICIAEVSVATAKTAADDGIETIHFIGKLKENDLYDLTNDEFLGSFNMSSCTLDFYKGEEKIYVVKFKKLDL